MAKLFIGIALLVMLATAALSFLAKGNIDKLQSRLKEAQGNVAGAEAKAKAAQSEATKAKEDLTAANAKTEEVAKDLGAKTSQVEDLSNKLKEATLLVEEKTRQLAAAAANPNPAPAPAANIEDPRIGELQGELAKAKAELAEAKQVSESMSGRVKDVESKLSAAESKVRLREAGSVRAGLQGRILAVNSGWNFVVLSVGDKQGVIVNAPLLVVRGSEPIARLRITSVEPSTSIADVLPGSVRRGVTVQPGDTVVFEGRSAVTQPAKPAEAADAVVAPALPH